MKKQATLNHTFRLIWSDTQEAFVAVSEHIRGKGKSKTSGLAAALLIGALSLFGSSSALAGPDGGVITSGTGSITQTGDVTNINQTSDTLQANWNSFNVDANETVNFHQPSKTSLAVNNILDTNGSRIMGNINANGQVWLINPNGVFFGQNATVNVGSILAATLNPLGDITTDGTQVFGNGGTGSIVNEGTINAESGYVAFIGNKVSNQGNITANNSTVALGAGSKVTLQFAGSNLLSLTVDQNTLDNLAENKQLIQANGGMVLMSAGARDSLLASVVNNEGKIQARTVQHKDGKIILMGGMEAGTTKVAGTLDASAAQGEALHLNQALNTHFHPILAHFSVFTGPIGPFLLL